MNHPLSLNPVLRSAFLWTLSGIATFTAAAYSQSPSNLGHQFWSTENGLPQISVHQILQSRALRIWIAAEHADARFYSLIAHVRHHARNDAASRDRRSASA